MGLSPERATEIKNSCTEESNFYCHKTISYTENNEGDVVPRSRICAGFLITMEKEGRANQPTRIAERLGLYSRSMLDMDAPVHDSMADWARSFLPPETRDQAEGLEHCGVVGHSCIDPAGFRINGIVFSNPEPGISSKVCETCEVTMCQDCTSKNGSICVECFKENRGEPA